MIIEGKRFEEVDDQRRKRSLKFRAKQRAMRAKIFNDPFYKQDRSQKNMNKVVAAKRRKRDDTGKFNFEPNLQQSETKKVLNTVKIDLTKCRQNHFDSEQDKLEIS